MNNNFLQRKRVLCVDDEKINLNILNVILKHHYEIKVALNGEQALKRAQSEPRPDIILLDIQMPDMDGYQVCNQLKQNPITQTIPVIFVTALSGIQDKAKGFAVGAIDYIYKPFDAETILKYVSMYIK